MKTPILSCCLLLAAGLLFPTALWAQDANSADAEPVTAQESDAQRFWFGSYGRLQPATHLDGARGSQSRIVWPAPRVDEGSYAELEFGYQAFRGEGGLQVDTVATLAFGDQFFHFNRDFDADIAVRNLYAEARNLVFDGAVLWVGSRMYRGDDVYLLDFWPLDNLNTFGAGFGWRGDFTRIEAHVGVNQRKDQYQFQVVDVVDERFIGSQDVIFLDRQRFISSLKAEQQFGGRNDAIGFKIKAHTELHALPSGEIRHDQPRTEETLPSDYGWLLGAQFGVWNFAPRSFANLFIRYAGGLAAYGEDAIPFGLNQDKRAIDAYSLLFALSGAYEHDYFGLILGAFARYFVDADRIDEDFDDGWDLAWSLRAIAFLPHYFTPGLEVSHQLRRPNGLSPVSLQQETASLWKLSLLPAFTFGDGLFARPQIRLNYTVSILNDAAQRLFPIDDRRRTNSVEHFIGLGVEWWFNSTSYQ